MVNDRFIELLSKKLADEISPEELLEFNYLLGADDHLQRYHLLKDYWVSGEEEHANTGQLFNKLRAAINEAEPPAQIVDYIDNNKKKIGRIYSLGAVAALLLAFLSFGIYKYIIKSGFQSGKSTLELTETPSREKSKITLSDGTVVTLNSETTLKYPMDFSGKTREVYLNGEAFFDVAKDHEHPFIVHTGKMSIRVLGTAFNVKSYQNDVTSETTLIRGAIEVTLSDRPSDRIILKPNDKLVLKNTVPKKHIRSRRIVPYLRDDSTGTSYALTNLTYFKANDTTVVETSWVNNKLLFKDEDFGELANKMERWYGVKIKFKNEEVKDYRFTGVFENESVSQALSALQLIEQFSYKIKKETIYIY